jgi:protein TonB
MSLRVFGWSSPVETASKVTLAPGDTSPQFESLRFGGGFAENLKECFRRAPWPVIGPSAFKIAAKKERVFGRAQAVALAVHAGIVVLIFLPSHDTPKVIQPPVLTTYLTAPDISAYTVKSPPGKDIGKGGGGGGQHSRLPATKGRVPSFTMTQFVPPSLPLDRKPALVADANLVGPPDLQVQSPNMTNYGDPLGTMFNDSAGPGHGGGIGDGVGPGIGNGYGPGLGPGSKGGYGGDIFRPGANGVGYPTCDYCPDAKYSEEARKAKFQGVVVLQVIVSRDGRATNIQVVKGPGLGLEEQAIAAVQTWRFKPALGPNHLPVATEIDVEVNFRLL